MGGQCSLVASGTSNRVIDGPEIWGASADTLWVVSTVFSRIAQGTPKATLRAGGSYGDSRQRSSGRLPMPRCVNGHRGHPQNTGPSPGAERHGAHVACHG